MNSLQNPRLQGVGDWLQTIILQGVGTGLAVTTRQIREDRWGKEVAGKIPKAAACVMVLSVFATGQSNWGPAF